MQRIPIWIFIIISIFYFSSVSIDLMDIDATQYAEISREMAQSGDYLHIYDRGINYLDKPPFLFWISSLGINIFGANNIGYRFFAIILAVVAIYATYRFASLWYDKLTAQIAALVLATSQAMFLMVNDVRCDLPLMCWVITSVWLLQEWLISKRWLYLLACSLAVALGLMSKGPIALIVPVIAFSVHWALKRDWKSFIKWQYLILFLLIGVALIPMCIGLYQQFDLYPNKFVDGKFDVSGLKFFFWTQSFGRITGDNVWNNNATILFQFQNMLWSFLPWIFILIPALAFNVFQLFKQKIRLLPNQEWISTGGLILTYFAVGLSKYQLPHYIFVAYPFAAIVSASFITFCYNNASYTRVCDVFEKILIIVGFLLFIAVFLILNVVFTASWLWYVIYIFCLAFYLYIIRKKLSFKVVWVGATCMFLINIFMTHFFYKNLLKYQVGCVVGKYIKEHQISNRNIIAYRMTDPLNSLHYYAGKVIRVQREKGYVPSQSGDYILTQSEGIEDLKNRGFELDIILKGSLYKVSELTLKFLNPTTRDNVTMPYFLCKVRKVGK